MDDETNQQNLSDLAAQIRDEQGLSSIPRTDWTYTQRENYVLAFKTAILQHQDSFTPDTVAIANRITPNFAYDYGATFDLSVSTAVLDAASSLGAPMAAAQGVVDALSGVGRGLSNVGALAPLLLPIGVIAAVFIFTRSGTKKLERAVSIA